MEPVSNESEGPSRSTDPVTSELPSPEKKSSMWFGLRRDPPRLGSALAASACVLLVFAVWWFVTHGTAEERMLSYMQLPSPGETKEFLPKMLDGDAPERHLVHNTAVSLKRVVIGFGLALLVGIPLGVLAGCFPIVRSFLSPLILFGRNIPVAALTALVFALFGTGELEKVMFIFIACVAFILSDTISAIEEVGQRYVETALTLGASKLQIMFKVLVPLAMPMVFNSLRVLFGLAFGYIMLVEIVQEGEGAGGLGYMLNISRRRGYPEIMVIIILTIPLVAWLIDQLLFVLQCWLFRWKYEKEAQQSLSWRLSRRVLRLFWRTA
ncbi:MAG: ABC transporter permease [Planctomycetaceae bacterium]|nr:ABC transporter permease [Planctomycetaceae bacterium]